MVTDLYYYRISTFEGLIQKKYEVELRKDNFSGEIYEKTGYGCMMEPYTFGVRASDIGKVDTANFAVCLLEDNPQKAVVLLQAAVKKKMLPLVKMYDLLEVEKKAKPVHTEDISQPAQEDKGYE